MPTLETRRLTLRAFTPADTDALLALLANEEVNVFLPMFPLKDREEAEAYLRSIERQVRAGGWYYAVCLKTDDIPIGCVHVSADDSHDLGYALRPDHWRQGICAEACRAVIGLLQREGVPYVTATHDVNNPRSGWVMRSIGMEYKYSYKEWWQPKKLWVTFRMYQLNLDGDSDRTYWKYWNKYEEHFVE